MGWGGLEAFVEDVVGIAELTVLLLQREVFRAVRECIRHNVYAPIGISLGGSGVLMSMVSSLPARLVGKQRPLIACC